MNAHRGSSSATTAIGVVASAGGVEALSSFAAGLPPDLSAAVLVVLHVSSTGRSVLPEILDRVGPLPARHARNGEPLTDGVIFVAPPGCHLTVEDGHTRVAFGPRENGHRPSADVLLRNLASVFGSHSAGVVLSGTMDDGAAGLQAIGRAGGLTLGQHPDEAAFPDMPVAAIKQAAPDVVGPISVLTEEIEAWTAQLSRRARGESLRPARLLRTADDDPDLMPFTCPDCGGNLSLIDEHGVQRFRCRVGHSYSHMGLLVGKRSTVETALWAAVVALEERADVTARIAKRLTDSGSTKADHYRREAGNSARQADFLRGLVQDVMTAPAPYDEEGSDADTTA